MAGESFFRPKNQKDATIRPGESSCRIGESQKKKRVPKRASPKKGVVVETTRSFFSDGFSGPARRPPRPIPPGVTAYNAGSRVRRTCAFKEDNAVAGDASFPPPPWGAFWRYGRAGRARRVASRPALAETRRTDLTRQSNRFIIGRASGGAVGRCQLARRGSILHPASVPPGPARVPGVSDTVAVGAGARAASASVLFARGKEKKRRVSKKELCEKGESRNSPIRQLDSPGRYYTKMDARRETLGFL